MLLIRTPGSGILQALDLVDKNPFGSEVYWSRRHRSYFDTGVTVQTARAGCGVRQRL